MCVSFSLYTHFSHLGHLRSSFSCHSFCDQPMSLRRRNSGLMHYGHHDTVNIRCLSCMEYCEPDNMGTCKVCYEQANENKEELLRKNRKIHDLESKISFLSLSSPADSNNCLNSSTADVTLIASSDPDAESVKAHKAILVSRSPIFRAMFGNDMEESRSGTVKISDVSHDVLRAFVNFLYTAEARLDRQMAYDLFVLAEKYQVMHLKTICQEYLMANLEDKEYMELVKINSCLGESLSERSFKEKM